MKKYIGLVALAVAITASSFTIKGSNNSGKFTPSYYWFSPGGFYHDLKTPPDEITITSCDRTSPHLCENAFNASQLINPGNPSAGVIAGQTPVDHIQRP